MIERSAFDILTDYPKNLGLNYDTHQENRRFYLFPNEPLLNTKFVIFQIDTLLFCAYDSYTAKANTTKTFTGIYKPIVLPEDVELKIYKRDWLDYFLRVDKRKTGQKCIDDNLTITSKLNWIPQKLTVDFVSLFYTIDQTINPLQIIIQNDHLQIIKDFKGKKVVGLETNQWIYKKEDLDKFIKVGGELIDNLIKGFSQLE